MHTAPCFAYCFAIRLRGLAMRKRIRPFPNLFYRMNNLKLYCSGMVNVNKHFRLEADVLHNRGYARKRMAPVRISSKDSRLDAAAILNKHSAY